MVLKIKKYHTSHSINILISVLTLPYCLHPTLEQHSRYFHAVHPTHHQNTHCHLITLYTPRERERERERESIPSIFMLYFHSEYALSFNYTLHTKREREREREHSQYFHAVHSTPQ